MTALMLTRIDDRRNMARFYKLDVHRPCSGNGPLSGSEDGLGVPGPFGSRPAGPGAVRTSGWL
jgi:hypothetical protein